MRLGLGGGTACAAITLMLVGGLLCAEQRSVQADERQAGPPLVQETFTGASADPGFVAVGSACLTGAPTGGAPPSGDHPLGGCPAGGTGPVPPDNGAPHGYLRLTDASNDQTAAVLYNEPLPAENGLEITFEQWQYGGTTQPPADGIAFFLVDGARSLTAPGAFGGSLGYAQKLPDDNPANPFLSGVDGGYVGVGLDVLGNYFGDWEHRGNGCAVRSPAGTSFRVPAPGQNMVTVRGPGDGVDGYCFLTATTSNFSTTGPWPSTLPGSLHGPTTSLPPGVTPAQAEVLLEPSRRTVTVHLSPAPDPVLTVSIDFHDGHGSQQVLSTPAPQPVPSTYKFGFSASTGLFTDVHLIRNVTVSPAVELPELNVVKQVPQDTPLPDVVPVGTRIPYQYVVTNSGNVAIGNLAVADSVVPTVTCPQSTLAPGETVICTGSYVVTQADVDAGHVTNTASAAGSVGQTTVTSPTVEVTVPLRPRIGLRLDKSVDAAHPYRPGNVVTYHYTVTNLTGDFVTDLAVADDRVGRIRCQAMTLAPAGEPGDSTTCTGTYTVVASDAGHQVTNTAVASGSGDLRSEPAQATITVAPPTPPVPPTPPPHRPRPHHPHHGHHGHHQVWPVPHGPVESGDGSTADLQPFPIPHG